MILNYTQFMAYGFRVGTDIPEVTVELALETAERYYFQQGLKREDYNAIVSIASDTTSTYYPLVNGGIYTDTEGTVWDVAGLRKGLAFIGYAQLLKMNVNATTFGSVQKQDEYSRNIDTADHIRYFLTVGLAYVREVLDILKYQYNPVTGIARETYFTRKEEKGLS